MDVSAISDALGGVTAAARLFGVPLGTMSAWKTRGAIPPEHWPRLLDLAAQHGIRGLTFEGLTRDFARKRAAKAPVRRPAKPARARRASTATYIG